MQQLKKHLAVTALLITALGTGYAYGQSAPFMVAGADAKSGQKVYDKNCASCHGKTGKGDGPVGKALNPKPRDFTKGDFKYGKSDKELADFIKKGKGPMPAWGKTLSSSQVDDVVAYIRTLKK